MRMGLSALNAQRRKYNFISDSKCPLCNMRAEKCLSLLFRWPGPGPKPHTIIVQGVPDIGKSF